jgi:hypothetical protein
MNVKIIWWKNPDEAISPFNNDDILGGEIVFQS